ncbi:serine/threonine protein kinase [bacterium]|nr:MAG: serine/threonine protein kinase [bacterium]
MAIILDKKISESATTCVYRAFDDTLGREVLLKVLHRHLAHDEHVRQRFVREARACASLRSENIVQIYDLREHEGSPAIIMEYVAGRSLKDVIADGKQRTFAFAEKVAVHVLRGLATAHAQGIIHRDIKPGNILVSAAGTVRITDFGLAQISVAPTLTTEGTIVGTPAYLAPELLRGEAADARADLFSLGATLVEILNGKQLFEGSTYSECLNRISRFKPEMLDPLAARSSPEFVAFLKKLMHPDRNQRYAAPGEALAALGRLGSSEFALPKSRIGRSRAKTPFLAAAAVATVLALLGAYFILKGNMVGSMEGPVSIQVANDSATSEQTVPADSQTQQSSFVAAPGPSLAAVQSPPERKRETALHAADSGYVKLVSSPGVKVQVDSFFVGELPLQRAVRLAAGPHTVVFSHPSFEPMVRLVQVTPAEELTVNADFLAQAAYLRCTSVPWAEISVDERYRDTTPMDRPILLSAGKHRVRFHHPAFRDSVWDVSLAPRETLRVSVTFKP